MRDCVAWSGFCWTGRHSQSDLVGILQDMESLHERLQTEVQETFADVLGSVSKDPAKNTGTRHLKFLISIDTYSWK